jgi:hypothetical protein
MVLIITSMGERSSGRVDGVPERAGRAVAHAVARGRAGARQLGDPAVREHLLTTGRAVVAKHGPDVADQAAQRAVDRALWGIAAHAGFVGAALHQLRPAAGRAAGKLARSVAARARRVEDP